MSINNNHVQQVSNLYINDSKLSISILGNSEPYISPYRSIWNNVKPYWPSISPMKIPWNISNQDHDLWYHLSFPSTGTAFWRRWHDDRTWNNERIVAQLYTRVYVSLSRSLQILLLSMLSIHIVCNFLLGYVGLLFSSLLYVTPPALCSHVILYILYHFFGSPPF